MVPWPDVPSQQLVASILCSRSTALFVATILISVPIAIAAGDTLQLSVEQHPLDLDARLFQPLQRDMQIGDGG